VFTRLWSPLIKRSQNALVLSQLGPLHCVFAGFHRQIAFYLPFANQTRGVCAHFSRVLPVMSYTSLKIYSYTANGNRRVCLSLSHSRRVCGFVLRPNKMYINTAAWVARPEEMLIWTTETAGYRFYERLYAKFGSVFRSNLWCLRACAVVGILHLILPEWWWRLRAEFFPKGNTRRSKAGLLCERSKKNWLAEWRFMIKMFQTRKDSFLLAWILIKWKIACHF
jgi:hypothetical protein